MPERPYYSSPTCLRELEAYYRALDELADGDLRQVRRLLIVGGSGPIVDLANNERVHDLILAFSGWTSRSAPSATASPAWPSPATGTTARASSAGKHVTGHCKEYDYKDGTGFIGTDFNMGPPPYPLEYILRDATGPDGAYHGNFGKRDLGDRRLPVRHRPLHAGLVPDRREDGRGPRQGPAPVRLVSTVSRRADGVATTQDRQASHSSSSSLADGITHMFGNPGTVEQGFLDALGELSRTSSTS